jgi:hypothetical protein
MNASNPDSGKDQTGKPASREMPFQGSLLSRLNSLGGAIACGLVALNFLGGCLMVVCAPVRSTSDYLKRGARWAFVLYPSRIPLCLHNFVWVLLDCRDHPTCSFGPDGTTDFRPVAGPILFSRWSVDQLVLRLPLPLEIRPLSQAFKTNSHSPIES